MDRHEIVSELSEEEKLKMEIVQSLLEPCDKKTYGKRLNNAAKKLGKSVRTIQRLVKKWEEDGISGFVKSNRADKGKYRISQEWQDFIVKTYREGNKGSKRISPKQVALRVEIKAKDLGEDRYPCYRTVYRVLQPIIEAKQQDRSIRNIGWQKSRLALKTRSGKAIDVQYSNHVWQCDHTWVDVLIVDKDEVVIGRPWLTTVIDTYSRCVMGIRVGFNAPSSQVVALALRHAMLPKNYPSEYGLHCEWGTYGKPEYLYTDGGKDFRSNHLQQIAVQLGFTCMLRHRPSEGGAVERPFGTLNTELFATLPGYTGSNIQDRPEKAEQEACLTLRELEKLIVRYIVDNYNQRIDKRMADQTRYQRWEAGLIAMPNLIEERQLDICLMKQTNRTIYRDGYIRFENLMYKGEYLAGYAGERVILRYEPRDITTVLVYRKEQGKDVFLARAFARDLETETITLEEIKASNKKLREKGQAISNHSILEEVRERDIFIQKKTKKDRQKEENIALHNVHKEDKKNNIEPLLQEVEQKPKKRKKTKVIDYEDLQNDYGF